MRGAGFDWRDRGWATTADPAAARAAEVLIAADRKAVKPPLAAAAQAGRAEGSRSGKDGGSPAGGGRTSPTAVHPAAAAPAKAAPQRDGGTAGGEQEAGEVVEAAKGYRHARHLPAGG